MSLEEELDRHPAWMYPWQLRDGRTAPLLGPELPSIHETRAAMIEPFCRQESGTAIDLACSEGWYSHRLLDWGAEQVLAVDVREQNVRRAELLRDHYGISAERLRFQHADVHDFEAEPADVVLCLGLIYHLEDPIGALRVARRVCRGVCAVETQAAITAPPAGPLDRVLGRGGGPAARYTWGTTGRYLETDAAWATRVEPDEAGNPIASHGGIVSLIPNRAALVEAMRTVGFRDVEVVDPPGDANAQFKAGDRLVAVGRV